MPVEKAEVKINPDLARERQKCTFDPEELAVYWIGDKQKLEEKRARGESEAICDFSWRKSESSCDSSIMVAFGVFDSNIFIISIHSLSASVIEVEISTYYYSANKHKKSQSQHIEAKESGSCFLCCFMYFILFTGHLFALVSL